MSRPVAALLLAGLLMPLPGRAPAGPQPVPGKDNDAKNPSGAFAGRTGATRAKLVRQNGGNETSEAAVALGLEWLAKQQRQDGGWAFDGMSKDETAAATGMALLAFLGAGETHKTSRKYGKAVRSGLSFLIKNCPANGPNAGKFAGSDTLYGQGIATLALVEAYGLTVDRPLLLAPAQAAVNFIQKAQAADGSWGYQAGTNGDTSILGWQIQALTAARATSDIKVEDKVLKKAVGFLDKVAAGEKKAKYGYTTSDGANPGTALTAVGLWCRQRLDGWDAKNPGLAEGVDGLLRRATTPKGRQPDAYFVHYATQVVRDFGGDSWATWNEGTRLGDKREGGLRDSLVQLQIMKEGANRGSWEPDAGFIGRSCGRLGTTALNLVALQVYYRSLPPAEPAKDTGDAPKKP